MEMQFPHGRIKFVSLDFQWVNQAKHANRSNHPAHCSRQSFQQVVLTWLESENKYVIPLWTIYVASCCIVWNTKQHMSVQSHTIFKWNDKEREAKRKEMRRRWEAYLIEWNTSDLQLTANRSAEQHPGGGPPDQVIGHHKCRRWIKERSICCCCHRCCCHRCSHPQPVPFRCTATTSQTAVEGETIRNYSPASRWPSGGGGGRRDTAPIVQGTGRQGRCQSRPGIFAWLNAPVNGWLLFVVVALCLLLSSAASSLATSTCIVIFWLYSNILIIHCRHLVVCCLLCQLK